LKNKVQNIDIQSEWICIDNGNVPIRCCQKQCKNTTHQRRHHGAL